MYSAQLLLQGTQRHCQLYLSALMTLTFFAFEGGAWEQLLCRKRSNGLLEVRWYEEMLNQFKLKLQNYSHNITHQWKGSLIRGLSSFCY